jgi:hypothetical protein
MVAADLPTQELYQTGRQIPGDVNLHTLKLFMMKLRTDDVQRIFYIAIQLGMQLCRMIKVRIDKSTILRVPVPCEAAKVDRVSLRGKNKV